MKRLLCLMIVFLLCASLAGAEEEKLSILVRPGLPYEDTYRFHYASTHFRDKYPQMDIEHSISQLGTYNQLIPALMAGDRGMDIIGHNFIDLKDMYENGLLVDLAEYVQLMESLSDWPDMMHLLGDGTHLFAVPESLSPWMVEVKDPSLLAELGVQIDPESWTWDMFFDIGEALAAYNAEQGTEIRLLKPGKWIPYWLMQYVMNECYESKQGFLDIEALRTMLARWKNAVDTGIILIQNESWEEQNQNVLFSITAQLYRNLGDRFFMLPPTYRENIRPTEVSGRYYFINPSSPHVQEALDYLTFYCHPEAAAFSDCYLSGIFSDSAQGSRANSPSEENHRLYQTALEMGYLHRVPKLVLDVGEIYSAYMAEKIDLEECVQKMVTRMEMNVGE